VPPRDTDALEKAINGLIMDRDFFTYLSENSRTRVRRHFDISNMVSATIKVYEKVLLRQAKDGPKDGEQGRTISGDSEGDGIGQVTDERNIPVPHNNRWVVPRNQVRDRVGIACNDKDVEFTLKFMEKVW
ncbi:MAG: hypothetical protein ABH843_01105, partial [Candidatus Omnitrophota bacterium]